MTPGALAPFYPVDTDSERKLLANVNEMWFAELCKVLGAGGWITTTVGHEHVNNGRSTNLHQYRLVPCRISFLSL